MKLKALIGKKLKSSTGESLAEVLIALLIAALALTMLASVIASASKIITQSKTKMAGYYVEVDKLADRSVPATMDAAKFTVTVKADADNYSAHTASLTRSTMSIQCYTITGDKSFQDTPIVAYWLTTG